MSLDLSLNNQIDMRLNAFKCNYMIERTNSMRHE